MASIETLHQLGNLTRYIIASEAPLNLDGYAYAIRKALDSIADNPTVTIGRFTYRIFEAFREFYNQSNFGDIYAGIDSVTGQYWGLWMYTLGYGEKGWYLLGLDRPIRIEDIRSELRKATISTISTNRLDELWLRLDQIISYVKYHLELNDTIVLREEWVSENTRRMLIANMKGIMERAFEVTEGLFLSAKEGEELLLMDFVRFMAKMSALLTNTPAGTSFGETVTTLQGVIVGEHHNETKYKVSGLSILFVPQKDLLEDYQIYYWGPSSCGYGIYSETSFNKRYSWLEIINLYTQTRGFIGWIEVPIE